MCDRRVGSRYVLHRTPLEARRVVGCHAVAWPVPVQDGRVRCVSRHELAFDKSEAVQ